MSKDAFWALIQEAKTACGQDLNAMEDYLREQLVSMGPAAAKNFHDILQTYEDLADQYGLWDAVSVIKEYGCSDDGFIDFRAWLIAQGKEVYMNALRDPDTLADTVLNRTDGVVDKLRLRLKDVLGVKQVPGNPNFRNGVAPHIWEDSGKVEWYAFRPSAADYSAMRQAVSEYLGVFRDRVTERRQDGPRLVYICAPLRGEVEKNIAFARDKAREVFAAGDVPICPHLMFPPIADPENPVQDQAAREMGLRLVESCQQVNVYGPVWTEGMWAEIRHAERLGIPVLTDQKELGRLQQKNTRKKEKLAYER